MAKVLKKKKERPRPGPEPRYDFDAWFDGQQWRLKQGEDFKCFTHSFINYLRRAAAKRQKKLKIISESEGIILVQAT